MESHYVNNLMYTYSKNKNYETAALKRLASNELDLLKFSGYENKAEKKKIKSNVKKYKKLNCYSSKNQHISVFLLLYCPFLFNFIYSMYNKFRTIDYDPKQ